MLEAELARHLRPVAAPDALWDRIQGKRQPEPLRTLQPAWAIAAVALLMGFGGAAWRICTVHDQLAEMQTLAARELGNVADGSGLHELTSIRSWLRAKGGIEIDLPVTQNAAVKIDGARLLQLRGEPVAAINYHAADRAAVLVVSAKDSNTGGNQAGHRFLQAKPVGNAQVVSWSMREKVYTVAVAGQEDAKIACLLCHGTQPM
jgi:anti-sigma factor RsiW